ncbi:hypothetical protein FDP41_010304 [Naegleria fowleri]|uniref:3'-5' exonuclease domain-containing protein n=1 Tax=Naegleria fowleri TaxID=5763 RepID=A0A6A5CD59_NAEFO|nr:uncharacterized protein FDP41_010304 [Naegleria fowleri]KAF0983239.1 hypothetical protein FDP41_010304 [Naegleria fowleri]CAG4712738.1 unnamed protein product [Naegleria fowleri]
MISSSSSSPTNIIHNDDMIAVESIFKEGHCENILSIGHEIHLIDSIEKYNELLRDVIQDLLDQSQSLPENDSKKIYSQTRLFNTNTPCVGLDCEGSPDLEKQSGTLCIIQLSLVNRKATLLNKKEKIDIYIIDVFKIGGKTLAKTNLRDLLESTKVLKIIHDGRRDEDVLFYQMNGTRLNFTWDTQVADICIKQSQILHNIPKTHSRNLSIIESHYISHFVKWFCYFEAMTNNFYSASYITILEFTFVELEEFIKKISSKHADISSDLLKLCAKSWSNAIVHAAHSLKSKDRKDAHMAAKVCRDVMKKLHETTFFSSGKDKQYFTSKFKNKLVKLTLERFNATLSKAQYEIFIQNNYFDPETSSKESNNNASILPMSSQLIRDLVSLNMFERTGYLNIIFISNLYYFGIINTSTLFDKIISVMVSQIQQRENQTSADRFYSLIRLNYVELFLEILSGTMNQYLQNKELTCHEINTNWENLCKNIKQLEKNVSKEVTSPKSPYLQAAKGVEYIEPTTTTEYSSDKSNNYLPLDIVFNTRWCIVSGYPNTSSQNQISSTTGRNSIMSNSIISEGSDTSTNATATGTTSTIDDKTSSNTGVPPSTKNSGGYPSALTDQFVMTSHYPVSNFFKIKGLVRLLHDFSMIDYSSKYEIQKNVVEQELYWKTRPLSQDQIECASMDVKHLLFLYETQRLFVFNKKFKPSKDSSSLSTTIVRRSHLYDRCLRDFEFPHIPEFIKEYLMEHGKMDDGYYYVDVPLDSFFKSKSENNAHKEQHMRLFFFPLKIDRECNFEYEDRDQLCKLVSLSSEESEHFVSKYYLGKIIGTKGRNIAELIMQFPTVSMGAGDGAFILIGQYKEVVEVSELLLREKIIELPSSQAGKLANNAGLGRIRNNSGCEQVKLINGEKGDPKQKIFLIGTRSALAKAENLIRKATESMKK